MRNIKNHVTKNNRFFKKSVLVFSFLGIVFLHLGCATIYNPATEKNEFILVDSQTEYLVGKRVVPELIKKHPLSTDKILIERLNGIGRKIALVSDRKDIEYNFAVLEDDTLNALTLPGGWIYVNKGLMQVFNDDELAYVVAHEVGHIAARHIAKKIQASWAYEFILGLATAGKSMESHNSAAVIKGIDAVYNLISLSYSRKDEFEADRLAVKYMKKAGFKPQAAVSGLEKLKSNEGLRWKVLEYFRTHPYVEERIKELKRIYPEVN